MNPTGVRAAEDYVAAADRAAEFGAQCREIETELKEEASSARLAIDMFLETQPAGAALPDGRAVQRVTKTSLRVVNEERLRAAFSSADTAGRYDSLADAVLDSLRRECTTVKQSVALRQAQGPALTPAPAPVERLCQQLDAAERGLSEVRRHKRTGSTQTKATMAPLHAAVAEAFAEAAGQPLPPAKRPKLNAEKPPELPTVVITEPPSVTLPGASEATPLPPLPEAAAPAAKRAQLTSVSDTVEGEIRVRVKTRDTKGRAPSYKQFAPRLRRLLQDRTELTDQLEQQAVDLLCSLRAASAETKSSLKIERKEQR